MDVLLIGEYSRLHNSLKEGLIELGHNVTLAGTGDGFKGYPVDLDYEARLFNLPVLKTIKHYVNRIFRINLAYVERGIRFYFLLPKLKGYAVVQLVNETPVKTLPSFERYLLKKLMKQNGKTFLLCCGIDYTVATYMLERKPRYSVMDPYFKDKSLPEYGYILEYADDQHKKTHDFLYKSINGVIASDMDYYLPLQDNPKFMGLVPNPVNLSRLPYTEPVINDKVVIFLGINRLPYNQKGIPFFEKALEIISAKYGPKVEIIIAENIPYKDYIKLYDRAHILLDQVYGYDQGYNALEAMAKGKVVFTGAEKEFMYHYGLAQEVAINALPNVDYLVEKLAYFIDNQNEIMYVGKRARAFIEKEHGHITVAQRYTEVWNGA